MSRSKLLEHVQRRAAAPRLLSTGQQPKPAAPRAAPKPTPSRGAERTRLVREIVALERSLEIDGPSERLELMLAARRLELRKLPK
jgi:hypothetical protein